MTQRVQQQQDRWWWLVLIVALLAMLGCGEPSVFARPQRDASLLGKGYWLVLVDTDTGCQYITTDPYFSARAITPRLHRRPNGRIEPMCGDTPLVQP